MERDLEKPGFDPICLVDGAEATWETLLPAAILNYGHISIMQVRERKVRGLGHHLDRLDRANVELFGRPAPLDKVVASLAAAVARRPDASLRINMFGGEREEHVMVTATSPIEPDWRPARFSLVEYERDMPHLKHVGSFGLTLRQRRALAEGHDGAVFSDRFGMVTEATIWNVGFFDGDAVIWPDAPTLRGVTQMLIDEGLAKLGAQVRYEPVPVSRLGSFRSAFLSNSNTFGRPLRSIGAHMYEVDPELTALIRRAYELAPLAPIGPQGRASSGANEAAD